MTNENEVNVGTMNIVTTATAFSSHSYIAPVKAPIEKLKKL